MTIPTQAVGDPPVAVIPRTPGEVAKAIVYSLFAVVAVLAAALADDLVSPVELVNAAIALVGALPVYWLAGRLAKTLVTFALAFLQALVTALALVTGFSDVTLATWLGILLSAGATIGVAIMPNAPALRAPTHSASLSHAIVDGSDARARAQKAVDGALRAPRARIDRGRE